MTAAAAIVLMLTAGYWFYSQQKTGTTQQPVAAEQVNDAAPGGNKAILTLADGSAVVLDTANNGMLSQQGSTRVQKTADGKLAYNSTSSGSNEVLYNTIATPRGGQYQMTLADGSRVWLNAASSLRFPVAFNGKERIVELTGEAYFEVAKNKSKPFKVKVAGTSEVEALGTHFNVHAYADEAAVTTTLLEGKVKVNGNKTDELILIPGEQSQFYTNGELTKNKTADAEAVLAWKNGKFNFGDEASIETVMRQIARWYDVNVEYRGTVKGSIGGSISRNVNASKVFEMLEMTGVVKFKIEGKKVIVMPK
jgi:transmembrane sensor